MFSYSSVRCSSTIAIALAVVCLATSQPARGQLFFSSQPNASAAPGQVGKYTLAGDPINSALIAGLQNPRYLTVAGDYLFVTERDRGTVSQYTLSGEIVNAPLISGLQGAYGLVEAGGHLFVTNADSGVVGEYTLSGEPVNAALITGLDYPTGITESGGYLFVTNVRNGTVSQFTTSGEVVNASFITGLKDPIDIKAAGGFLYISCHADGELMKGSVVKYRINHGPSYAGAINGLTGPEGITVGGNRLYVALYPYAGGYDGGIAVYDATTLEWLDAVSAPPTTGAFGVAVAGPTPPPPPTIAQALNISSRSRVQSGENAMIGGFIVSGSSPTKVLIRAIGPSMRLRGVVSDPSLELHMPDGTVITNDNWKIDDATHQSQQAVIEATGAAPAEDLESAIVATLSAGSYTAVVGPKSGSTGIGLVEVYDLSQSDSDLRNISTRGLAGPGSDAMIGGFILGPEENSGAQIVVRAIGPSLERFGIQNALQDPRVFLHDANGTVIGGSHDWQDHQGTAEYLQSVGLAPDDPRESAIVASLTAGAYTAVVRGADNTVGVALVEIYNLR